MYLWKVMPLKQIVRASKIPGQQTPTSNPADFRPHFTPKTAADRWHWHEESVRRALRERRLDSIIIGRRRLIPASEIDRAEREGFVARVA
jgi:hypothetical protein